MANIDAVFLHYVKNDDAEKVVEMMRLGIKKDIMHLALLSTMDEAHIEMFLLLLKGGADIHVDDDYYLQESVRNNELAIVAALLNAGADVHAHNDEALRLSVSYDRVSIVKLLLKHGADARACCDISLVHAVTKFAQSKHCINSDLLDIIKVLLEYDANLHVDNDKILKFFHEHFVFAMLHHDCNPCSPLTCNNFIGEWIYALADAFFPYCSECDYIYFPDDYVRIKHVLIKRAQ